MNKVTLKLSLQKLFKSLTKNKIWVRRRSNEEHSRGYLLSVHNGIEWNTSADRHEHVFLSQNQHAWWAPSNNGLFVTSENIVRVGPTLGPVIHSTDTLSGFLRSLLRFTVRWEFSYFPILSLIGSFGKCNKVVLCYSTGFHAESLTNVVNKSLSSTFWTSPLSLTSFPLFL